MLAEGSLREIHWEKNCSEQHLSADQTLPAACRIDLDTFRMSPAASGRLTHRWEFGRHDASSLSLVFSVLFLSPPSIISAPIFWFNRADARRDWSVAAAERPVFPFCNGRASKFSSAWLLQLPVEEPVIHVRDANWSLRESLCNTETVQPSHVLIVQNPTRCQYNGRVSVCSRVVMSTLCF